MKFSIYAHTHTHTQTVVVVADYLAHLSFREAPARQGPALVGVPTTWLSARACPRLNFSAPLWSGAFVRQTPQHQKNLDLDANRTQTLRSVDGQTVVRHNQSVKERDKRQSETRRESKAKIESTTTTTTTLISSV